MPNKYELTDETLNTGFTMLRRIRAVRSFWDVEAGSLGGWIEKPKNLSQEGDAWVFDDAQVFDDARVSGSAQVSGSARIETTLLTATRSDTYTFAIALDKDGELRIMAGCRYFTIKEAREHWTRTRGGAQLGDESLALVDHLERMWSVGQKYKEACE